MMIINYLKKKKINEKNIFMVNEFKKVFFNLNQREPLDQEIIDNLNDKIDINTLNKLIEESKVNNSNNV